jgi:Arc/MetJ-type ribon-helix-helix transcriptional regulator
MCMTESITVRLTPEEIREIKKHGRVSDVVRQAIRLFMQTQRSQKAIEELKQLQASSDIRITIDEDLNLIRGDRQR